MKSRVLALIAAAVLAVAGSFLLIAYTNGAEKRALAGVETSEVLIVSAEVPAGTPADVVLQSATRQEVPAKARPADAVSDPAAVSGLVTTVGLVPGEQLLSSRFRDPATTQDPGIITVPAGMQEISILLEPQRTVGGRLQAGDTVGVFISTAVPTQVSHLTLHKVLVTAVQGATTAAAKDSASGASAGATSKSVMVTLALTAANAEKLVYGQEFGTIWLSAEPATAGEAATRELTRDGIYK